MAKKKPKEYSQKEVIKYGLCKHHLVGYKQLEDLVKKQQKYIIKKDKVLEMFDERFLRMWEFYLAGCEMAFKWGDQVVFQFQLSKKLDSVPNTRDYIYQQ